MASSSVSPEDLDREENDVSVRKTRIRTTRIRPQISRLMDSADHDHSGTNHDATVGRHSPNSTSNNEAVPVGTAGDSESPKLASRAKDKRVRPNHVNKGKAQRDRRKLREKRRSTGVVHLPSNESTGEDDDETVVGTETKKNTVSNEVIDKPEEERIIKTCSLHRNKSPSDLDADDEDNQDYDNHIKPSHHTQTSVISTTAVKLRSSCLSEALIPSNYDPLSSTNEDLVKLLEKEREENRRLLRQLEQKDRRIEYLEKEIELLNQDLHAADIESERLRERQNLYQSLQKLSTK